MTSGRQLTFGDDALDGFELAPPPAKKARAASSLPAPGTPGPVHAHIETVFYAGPKFTAGLLVLDNGQTAKFSARMFLRPAGPTVYDGEWVIDPKHGLQFSIQGVVKDSSLTAEGLARYLSFLPVKGLGPARAQILVDAYGPDLPRALRDPQAVAEETGLPRELIQSLAVIWEKNEKSNSTATWLAAAGLTALQTQTLIDRFGDSIQDILQEDPYSLIRALKGFGFKRIDEIAVKTGTAPDDPARVSAAISHAVLQALEEEGHSWLRESELERRICDLLGVSRLPNFRASLDTAVEEEDVILVQHKDQTLVAHPRAYARETDLISIFSRPVGKNPHFAGCNIQAFLVEMGLLPPEAAEDAEDAEEAPERGLTPPPSPGGPAAGDVSDEFLDSLSDGLELVAAPQVPAGALGGAASPPSGAYLNAEQLEAVIEATTSNIALLSGGAGSGKTFTITALLRLYEAQGLKVELTAPTGRAAKRIEEVVGRPAQTLHRLLGSNGRTFLHEDQARFAAIREADDTKAWDANVIDSDVVIVDEVSMVDIDLAWHFFQSLDLEKTMVVLVGDHNQLPPVGPGSILRDLIARRPIPTVVLGTVMRQSGPLKDNSVAILKGEVRPSIPVSRVPAAPQVPAGVVGGAASPPREEPHEEPGAHAAPGPGAPAEGDGSAPTSQVVALAAPQVPAGAVGGAASPPREIDFSPWIVKDAFEDPEEARRFILRLYRELLTERLGFDIVRDVQLLSPMKKGVLGTLELNRRLQAVIQKKLWGVTVKTDLDKDPPLLVHDRVIQVQNNYELGVMNGTIGNVAWVDLEAKRLAVTFDGETEPRVYERKFWSELQLAYALTVHKAQGAEFPCVISVMHQTHAHMHHRNLFYTSVTRARKTSILVGSKRAMERCAKNTEAGRRNTFLSVLPMREARATRALGTPRTERGKGGGGVASGSGKGSGQGAAATPATVKTKAPGFMFDDDD